MDSANGRDEPRPDSDPSRDTASAQTGSRRVTRILLRAAFVWLMMMAVESVHGVLRTILIAPRTGDFRARQIGAVIGSLLVIAVACVCIKWIGANDTASRWKTGLLWVALTLIFEFALGRLAFGYSWARILEDYDLSKGGLMIGGMLAMALAPFAATALRSSPRRL